MSENRRGHQINGAALLLTAAVLTGCGAGAAGRVVQPGDGVGLHFACLLPSGQIAADSRPDRARAGQVAPIYLEREGEGPVLVEAGQLSPADPASARKSFELEIIDRLAAAVVGANEGDSLSLDLVAPRIPDLPAEEQYVKLVRVRKRAKELKMPLAEYKQRTGKEAAVGHPYLFDPLVPGMVTAVGDAEVVINFAAQPDSEVRLPFGKGVIREREDRYEIEVSAEEGSLVRAGALVGRVSKVDAEFIELDFGHPFGGETLKCEVTVASVEPGVQQAEVAERQDGAPHAAEPGEKKGEAAEMKPEEPEMKPEEPTSTDISIAK